MRKFYDKKKLLETGKAFLFLSPNIFGFLLFTLLPVIASFLLSFCYWDLKTPIRFAGLSNFFSLITDQKFWKYFGNTLFFMLNIPISMGISLFLALLMNRKLPSITFFRTIYFLPVISSMVACALLWRWIYNPDFGLINNLLKALGLRIKPLWLASTDLSKPSIMIMWLWKGAGFNMLLYLAALQNIPRHLYEAADIDGANAISKFFHITWPMLSPTNFFILTMGIIGGFQAFGEIYVMTRGGPMESTTTIVYSIYNNAFIWDKFGYASAMAWFLFIIIFIATYFQWRITRERVQYELL